MSNEQLIQAIIDYPFICNVFLYSTPEDGVKAVETICDAYAELVSRSSGKEALVSFLEKRGDVESLSIRESTDNEYLIRLLLYQEKFQDSLTVVERDKFTQISIMEQDRNHLMVGPTSTQTPSGSYIYCVVNECSQSESHQNEHNALDADVLANYNVIKVRNGTCMYNCHSYAWYSQDINNEYWIGNPAPYMTDGSYTKILNSQYNYSLSVAPGTVVFYGTISNGVVSGKSHSAIIYDTPTTGDVLLRDRTVISKWGEGGLFIHNIREVPKEDGISEYDIENISAWYRP